MVLLATTRRTWSGKSTRPNTRAGEEDDVVWRLPVRGSRIELLDWRRKKVGAVLMTGRNDAGFMGTRSEDKKRRKTKEERQRIRDLNEKDCALEQYILPKRFRFRRCSESIYFDAETVKPKKGKRPKFED